MNQRSTKSLLKAGRDENIHTQRSATQALKHVQNKPVLVGEATKETAIKKILEERGAKNTPRPKTIAQYTDSLTGIINKGKSTRVLKRRREFSIGGKNASGVSKRKNDESGNTGPQLNDIHGTSMQSGEDSDEFEVEVVPQNGTRQENIDQAESLGFQTDLVFDRDSIHANLPNKNHYFHPVTGGSDYNRTDGNESDDDLLLLPDIQIKPINTDVISPTSKSSNNRGHLEWINDEDDLLGFALDRI